MDASLDIGLSRRLLGKIYLTLDKPNQAESELRWSLQILSDLNSEYEIAKTRLILAALLMPNGSPTEAQTHLSQSIKTFKRLGVQDALAEALDLKQQQNKQAVAV